jgi:hypothetical protein
VLPSTLVAESDGGGSAKIEFRRIIVHPGGREEVEGVTPKQLPPPSGSSHMLPNDDQAPVSQQIVMINQTFSVLIPSVL